MPRQYQFSGKEDLILEVASLYTGGMKAGEIAKKIGKSRALVCLYLKHSGTPTVAGTGRKIALNEDFFQEIDTHEKAYWLGFLLADGHIPKMAAVRVELQASDREHLVAFLQSLKSDSRIRESVRQLKGSENRSVWTIVCSVKMKNDLLVKGWQEFKKRGDLRIVEDVPTHLKPSLLRGLFDGDGCFMAERATFVDAHLSVVHWFQEELVRASREIKRSPVTPNPRGTSYVVKWSGRARLQAVVNHLYSTPGPHLRRKRETADATYFVHSS